jgi:hypothetical protein
VWGTSLDGDNVVWGTDCGGADCGDNVVWGTMADGDNVVWGTASEGDNVVWGTSGVGVDMDLVWASSGEEEVLFPDDASAETLPDVELGFGDYVPVAEETVVPVLSEPLTTIPSILPVVGPVSIGGI